MGLTATAVLSTKIVSRYRPRYLIMAGIAAGIRGVTNIGDILVAETTWDYGSGKITNLIGDKKFAPDPRSLTLDIEIKEIILQAKREGRFLDEIYRAWPGVKPSTVINVQVGPVLSGAAVVQDATVIESIKAQTRKLLGVEMETYAVFYSAYNSLKPRPIPISIKCVCDYADEDKNDNFQAYASFVSAHYIYRLALEYL
jgi:nucleoside phosphorylase